MANMDPLNGKLVVLLGGSGLLGTPLAQLGQMQFARFDASKPETIAPLLAGADAAVYLVGAFSGDLDALQASGAGHAARAAKQAGVTAFTYVSAIGADAHSEIAYARTKAEGEQAVLAAFPEATILRPSVLFGEDDNFINRFAGLIARMPVMPVFAPQAKLQPLHVDDAARAVGAALADPANHGGKTYEIAGPEAIDVLTLNRAIADAQSRQRLFAALPDAVSSAIATLTGWLPGAPLTRDQWHLLKAGNTPSGQFPGIGALGVTPRPLELFLNRWMVRFRKHGRFGTSAKMA